ncbi:unnamed protein product [Dibothriocephalus latus]|uniref:G-protein coupled receptors family 1 profile domain-containing protein n=1 Tax=Dibothriocephalus latus TaxID=60516 RepID=A0A3P6SFK1_DIBLA|nr:unnamed protein product [Dibothriocephalus latus]
MELRKAEGVVDVFKTVMLVYIGGPITVVGIITSILSLLMFKRDTATSASTRLLLSAIAVVDILFLACCFIFWTIRGIFGESPAFAAFMDSPFVYGFLFYVCNVFEMVRNWLIVVLAVERLLFFMKPLEFKSIWCLSRVRGIIIAVILLSLLVRLPVLLFGIAKHDSHLDQGVTRTTRLIHALTDCLVLTTLPVTVMIVLSTLTTARVRAMIEMKRQVRKPSETPKEEKKEAPTAATAASGCPSSGDKPNAQQKHHRIIKILHTVLITFIIFCSPAVLTTSVHAYVAFHNITSGPVELASKILSPISNAGSLLNSTSNFFVYIIQSRRYQRIIVEMLALDRCGFKKLLKVTNKLSGSTNASD